LVETAYFVIFGYISTQLGSKSVYCLTVL